MIDQFVDERVGRRIQHRQSGLLRGVERDGEEVSFGRLHRLYAEPPVDIKLHQPVNCISPQSLFGVVSSDLEYQAASDQETQRLADQSFPHLLGITGNRTIGDARLRLGDVADHPLYAGAVRQHVVIDRYGDDREMAQDCVAQKRVSVVAGRIVQLRCIEIEHAMQDAFLDADFGRAGTVLDALEESACGFLFLFQDFAQGAQHHTEQEPVLPHLSEPLGQIELLVEFPDVFRTRGFRRMLEIEIAKMTQRIRSIEHVEIKAAFRGCFRVLFDLDRGGLDAGEAGRLGGDRDAAFPHDLDRVPFCLLVVFSCRRLARGGRVGEEDRRTQRPADVFAVLRLTTGELVGQDGAWKCSGR